MKLQYLGTAAAEAFPAIFCHCDTCRRARLEGGKNIRMRAGLVVNDTVLIDLPPDIYALSLSLNLDLGSVTDVFITHSHSDHFAVRELGMRGNGCFCYIGENGSAPALNLYGNDGVEALLNTMPEEDRGGKDVKLTRVSYFETYTAANGLRFTYLPASHKSDEHSGFYLVEGEGKRLVYAQDTGLFPEETLAYLAGKPLDFLSLDCCFGRRSSGGWGHMGLPENRETVSRLREKGAVTDGTIIVVNHFSHNCGQLHEELEAEARPDGFLVSYDGMTVDL
ncbi:MAG: hypothetical protein HFJ79_09160 [Clostridiales bacterium]|nr:hypothetical protein [Clostridiales bacterium]